MTDACGNITLPQASFVGGKKSKCMERVPTLKNENCFGGGGGLPRSIGMGPKEDGVG